MIKRLIATILLTLAISCQAQAARTLVMGFEMGSTGEFINSAASVQSTVKRTGTYALQANSTTTAKYAQFQSRQAGGTLRSLFSSCRFYVRVDTDTGGHDIRIASLATSTPTVQTSLYLRPAGVVGLEAGATTGTESTDTVGIGNNQWYRIDWNVSAGAETAYINGGANPATMAVGVAAQPTLRLGAATNGTFTSGDSINIYIDDVMCDDGSATIGAGQSLMVFPTTDPGSLNSWTGGAGGTTNIWDAVNNIPPVGLAPASETNTSQIKNAASGGNLDYIPTTQSYQTAGVGASDTINGVMAIGNDCEEITTGTKAGGYWIGTNPAQTAGGNSFDFGDDTATVCGTFTSGWITHYGPVTTSGITIGSTATVAIRKTTGTTRVTDADFLGIYVDYTPFVAGAVKRLPLLGIGAWLLTRVTDIYNSLFEPSVAYAQGHGPKAKDTSDVDFLGIYVDYTPSGAAQVSPHFVPTPVVNR